MGAHKINILCYTEDDVAFAECEDSLQRLHFQFYTASNKKGKKCMITAKVPLKCKLGVENYLIKQVMQTIYL